MKRLLIVGFVALSLGTQAAIAGMSDRVVGIDKQGFRADGLVWVWSAHRRASTLADFVRVFGHWSSCAVSGRDAIVVWRTVQARGVFTTLGAFPHPRDNGCTSPAFVHPDNVTVVGEGWRTDRSLRGSDTIERLRGLYPSATRHGAVWWLVTRRDDPLWGTYGQLTATAHDGRIAAFTLVLHEEGD